MKKAITVTINENVLKGLQEVHKKRMLIHRESIKPIDLDNIEETIAKAEEIDKMRKDVGIQASVLCDLIYETYINNQ